MNINGAALFAEMRRPKPITLIGGGTTKVGDRRSGRNERPLLDNAPSTPTFSGMQQVFRKIPVVWRPLTADGDHAETNGWNGLII